MPWDIRGRDQLEQALQNAGLAIIAVENVAEAQELAVAVRGSDDKARLRAELEALVNEADESEFARLAAAVTASPDDGLDERVIVYVSAWAQSCSTAATRATTDSRSAVSLPHRATAPRTTPAAVVACDRRNDRYRCESDRRRNRRLIGLSRMILCRAEKCFQRSAR